jgi:hypothetical protein
MTFLPHFSLIWFLFEFGALESSENSVNMFSKVNFAVLRLLKCCVGLVPELKTGYGWWQLLFDVRCVLLPWFRYLIQPFLFHNFINFFILFSDDWEIPFENISDLEWLGSGAQGAVFVGRYADRLRGLRPGANFISVVFTPSPPSDHGSAWVLYLSSLYNLHCIASVGSPNHMIGEVSWDPKRRVFNPLGLRPKKMFYL